LESRERERERERKNEGEQCVLTLVMANVVALVDELQKRLSNEDALGLRDFFFSFSSPPPASAAAAANGNGDGGGSGGELSPDAALREIRKRIVDKDGIEWDNVLRYGTNDLSLSL
jgi:hypothetical protein